MTIRRHCDPINIKRIWDAIRSANVSHQTCDVTRILKFLQKGGSYTQTQVDLYVKQALKDGLIIPTRKSNPDSANATFKITEQELPELDNKDWYCFECHLAGEVNLCDNCFRVFHSDCIKSAKKKFNVHKNSSTPSNKSKAEYKFNESLCSVCNIINIDECKVDKAEMNYLLKFVLHRIRAWLPNTITHTMAQEDRPTWLTDSELTWRANQLFFEHRDMSVIEVNINCESYTCLSEFLADILTVQHNVAIFHGMESQEYQAAELMVRDTLHDITELRNCSDCYKSSNEKINARWFALPCRDPHKLVWAKQKGYPYWPAKVIKETSSHCDVRFFGGKHERSLIPNSFIKPISVSKESLKIKASSAFTKALEELIYHQQLLADPQELSRILADAKSKRPAKKSLSPILPTKKKGKSTLQTLTSTPMPINAGSPSRRKLSSPEIIDTPATKRPKNESETETPEKTSSEDVSGNVIDISDGEEEETDYSFRGNSMPQDSFRFDESYEQVSSSTENYKHPPQEASGLHQLDQPYSDSVEKMRRKVETLSNKAEIIKCAMDCMQAEVDRITEDHNEHLKRLFESHNAQISETKKKQWCYNCEQDAIYHCCWNTAYCSQTCQQQHWQAEHKKVCRRKRQT